MKKRFKSEIKLDTSYLKQLKRELNKLNKTEVEFGWINGKKYPSSSSRSTYRQGAYIASVAYINEKGHYTINDSNKVVYVPARPYFQQAMYSSPALIRDSVVKVMNNALRGLRYHHVLNFIGQDLVDNVKKSVSMQNYKDLHNKTVNIKGSSVQWTDTGRMLKNITYKVTYVRKGSGKTYGEF